MRREKRLRGTFHSVLENDSSDGFYYEVVGSEAIPSDPSNPLHKKLSLFGYALRTDYGVQRVFPSDGDVFVRILPHTFQESNWTVELEEIDVK